MAKETNEEREDSSPTRNTNFNRKIVFIVGGANYYMNLRDWIQLKQFFNEPYGEETEGEEDEEDATYY